MSLEVRIQGAEKFRQVAQRMRTEGRKDLSRQMADALGKTTIPVQQEIRRETEAAMPSEGGYRALISASLAWRISRRLGGQRAQIILATYADGLKERRDIRALNRGILRHPVYGRSRKIKVGVKAGTILPNPWAVTAVRGGFHERGTEQAIEHAQDEMRRVVAEFADRLV